MENLVARLSWQFGEDPPYFGGNMQLCFEMPVNDELEADWGVNLSGSDGSTGVSLVGKCFFTRENLSCFLERLSALRTGSQSEASLFDIDHSIAFSIAVYDAGRGRFRITIDCCYPGFAPTAPEVTTGSASLLPAAQDAATSVSGARLLIVGGIIEADEFTIFYEGMNDIARVVL